MQTLRSQDNARRKAMSAVEPYGTANLREEISEKETPRSGGPELPSGHPRRGLRRGVGLLAGLVGLALVGVLAYNLGTSYFALNGAWYGTLRVQIGPGRVSLEAYMDLATYLNGSLAGSGKVCYHNLLGGGTTALDLRVSGQRNAEKVTLAFAVSTATLGIPVLNINLGPELDLQGRLATSPANTPLAGTPLAGLLSNGVATAVNLSGGTGAFPVTLEMRRGMVAQFASACAALSPLGERGSRGGKRI
jgi:hypothetical protein